MARVASKKIGKKADVDVMNNMNAIAAFWQDKRLRNISIAIVACTLLYYLPALVGAFGWQSTQASLIVFRNYYGIDFYGLIFFIPVIYAAYTLGIVPAVLTAFIVFLVLVPQAIMDGATPNVMFRPTAFIIILSAVGAVVAMLQKSEQEQRQRMKEMKCIYDIGKATGTAATLDEFLDTTISFIVQAMPDPEMASVVIKYQDRVIRHSRPARYQRRTVENILVNGEVIGQLIIRSTADNPYVKKQNHLTKTLAERIGGAIHEIELTNSLQTYYSQLEDEVSRRIKDLEVIQNKLIRSERLTAVGEMASGVGHELRNPLNVMRNCIYLLRSSGSDSYEQEKDELLSTLDKQVDASNKIVTDLLDFTRLKEPLPGNHSLAELVNASMGRVETPENIRVINNSSNSLLSVFVDAEQIDRVLTNIIANAIQSMKEDKGTLEISSAVTGNRISITFSDTGCGIPEKNLGKVFEPLFTTKPKGIGLGLAISRRLIEQNKGQIGLTSREHCGTKVTITLPLAAGEESIIT